MPNPYKVPLVLHEQGFTKYIVGKLGLDYREPDLSSWAEFVNRLDNPVKSIKVGTIGKYTKIRDSYVSIIETLRHAAAWNRVKVELIWVEATDIENNSEMLKSIGDEIDGAIILPGFGVRGAEGRSQLYNTLGKERNLYLVYVLECN
jgi:CTP synthase